MKKNELNPSIRLSEGNFKLEGNSEVSFLVFNLPSKITCPFATAFCKKKCFAQYPEYMFSSVRQSRHRNLEESKKETFTKDMIDYLEYELQRKKYKNKILYIRIHESGDFWSQGYFNKWVLIANHFKTNPRINFQAYTKSLPYIENEDLKQINIKLMYSVMPDTQPEEIKKAKLMGLTLFELIPIGETRNDAQNCIGNCHECMICYKDNNIEKIFVEFHGVNVKSHKAKDTGNVHPFEKINEYRKKLVEQKNKCKV